MGVDSTERQQILQQLAAQIKQHRLGTPVAFVVDTIRPLAFIASQCALFIHPIAPRGHWHEYVGALTHEAGWAELYDLLESPDC